jgi:hypothetical protein
MATQSEFQLGLLAWLKRWMYIWLQERTKEAERARKEALDALRRLKDENDRLQVPRLVPTRTSTHQGTSCPNHI